MKKLLLLIVANVFSIVLTFAQGERVKPTCGVTLERKVYHAKVEGKIYSGVTVELKAAEFGDLFVDGVKVVITDNETGKRIYSKRFSKSYLYAFSDGTIQVGKGNALTQIILDKDNGDWMMILKEKGIY